MILASSRSILEKVLSPTKEKYLTREKSKSPPRVRPILMTRRQLTDPFGSDDEEEKLQIIDDKWSQSISITKSATPVRDVSIYSYRIPIKFFIDFIYDSRNKLIQAII